MDDSEIIISELNKSIANLYKLIIEETGYDLGETENDIEYHNYLIDNPLDLIKDSIYDDNLGNLTSNIDFTKYKGTTISLEDLSKIFKNANKNYMGAALSTLEKYGDKVGLTKQGKLLVLAQFAHESGGFRYIKEIGNGKGKKYGLPAGPYKKLYYGRGPIQITWDYNYKLISEKYFKTLGINADIYKYPELCETNLEIGCAASLCWFFIPGNGRRAVDCANKGDVIGLSKAINGGYNGLEERKKYTALILQYAK